MEYFASELSIRALKDLLIKVLHLQLQEVVPGVCLDECGDLSEDFALSQAIQDGLLVKFDQLQDELDDSKSQMAKGRGQLHIV